MGSPLTHTRALLVWMVTLSIAASSSRRACLDGKLFAVIMCSFVAVLPPQSSCPSCHEAVDGVVQESFLKVELPTSREF